MVCNLNIAANAFALKNHRSSTLCIYNYGTISNCNVTLNGFDTNSTNRNFGGLCSDNMGYIISCSADISAKAEQLWCGGMCWYNYNIIVDCTFKGHLSSNNNYNLGGIAVLNYEYSKMVRICMVRFTTVQIMVRLRRMSWMVILIMEVLEEFVAEIME